MKPSFNSAPKHSLLTDFYELTMAASYYEHKKDCLACFDLFIRNFPKGRSFFIAAGLSDVIHFLKNFRFSDSDILYLKGLKAFSQDFLNYLSQLRFRGSLWAVSEGTVFFPNEPVIRIVASLIEGQIIETFLLNAINVQTTIATKATRVALAAKGKNVYDFSLRRTHGKDAGLKAARASYIAGFKGTSNVLAGKRYRIPVVGTMAHSFVMAFNEEIESFRAFVTTFPKYATLLVDTYDTLKGVKNAIQVAHELEKRGQRLRAIRLDSGNFARLAYQARHLLDKEGCSYVKILASGSLDEYAISALQQQKAPIDSFGVGTKVGVSADCPYCDVIYKLSEITNASGKFLPAMKLSQGKATLPGRKQVFRQSNAKGIFNKDIIGLEGEKIDGWPLLRKIIDNGVVVYKEPSLNDIQKNTQANLSGLPKAIKKLGKSRTHYPVSVSPELKKLTREVKAGILRKK